MKFAIRYGLLALIFTTNSLFAQAPKGINYQGIARDMEGKPLAQREISIRISVLAGSAEGEVEYDEIHEVRTNSFGLFTLVIGQGQAGMGAFNFISWALGGKWLQIELDENGGRNFQLMGSQQLMSVPYALYAEYAGNGYTAGEGISISNNTITNTGDGDVSSTNELITGVSFGADNKLRITDAGGTQEADLSTLVGASQNLSGVLAQGNDASSVAITNLGSPVNNSDAATKAYVDSHTDGDADAGNEIQDLSLTTNNLKITNNPSAASIDLSPFLDNTDNQNLTSSASGTNRTVNISGGTGTTINVADNDNSGTNEVQTLSKLGSSITLSNVGGTGGGSVVLNDDSNTNEAQTISRIGNTVTLSDVGGVGGGSFTDAVDDADSNPSNEIQALSLTGFNLSISSGNTVSLPINSHAFQFSYDHTVAPSFTGNSPANIDASNISLDISSALNTSTEEFIIPSNGVYSFFISGNMVGLTRVGVRINGNDVNVNFATNIATDSNVGSILLNLNAGDRIQIVGEKTAVGVTGQMIGSFSGFKL